MTVHVVLDESLQKEAVDIGVKAVVFEADAFETGISTIRTADDEGFANLSTNPDYRGLAEDHFGDFVLKVLINHLSDTERLPGSVWDLVKGQCMAADRPFQIRGPAGAYALATMRQK
ncbi:hypothetical protein CSPX01_01360 [Colletotrichum filicis]|nr:hypothetical protein CSPX01_01360 [Colletotrichum filicis]